MCRGGGEGGVRAAERGVAGGAADVVFHARGAVGDSETGMCQFPGPRGIFAKGSTKETVSS